MIEMDSMIDLLSSLVAKRASLSTSWILYSCVKRAAHEVMKYRTWYRTTLATLALYSI